MGRNTLAPPDHRLRTTLRQRRHPTRWPTPSRSSWHGYPFVVMGVGKTGEVTQLRLSSGEARVLARQLVHFADAIDLERIK
jgi:hypothetical protein